MDMEAWARFRPATEISEVARKPEGVRAVAAEEDVAASAAMDCSRSALALSRFSS